MAEHEEWVALDGSERSSNAEIMRFRGEAIFTIRAHDGDKPPKLRSAPLTDSLNLMFRRMGSGTGPPTLTLQGDGPVWLIVRENGPVGERAELIRVTGEDAAVELSRGESGVTSRSIGEAWLTQLDQALRFVADSVAATGRGSAP